VRRKTVRSPLDGVVVARHKSTGEYIEDQAIVTIAQLDPLRVEVIAPVELFGMIEQGMSAEVISELESSGPHTATVVSVDRVIDGASGTFDVRLELPNPDYKIPSGLKCQVKFGDAAPRPSLEAVEVPTDEAGPAPAISPELVEGSAPLPDTDADASPLAAAAPLAACNAIGPLTDDAEADRIAQALGKLAARITPARQFETVIESYLVAAPMQATQADTERVQEQILAHGVTDTMVIEKGEFKGQISFGVYNEKRPAERRRLDLQKLGFQVDLKPRLSQQPRIWLEVETTEPDVSEVRLLQAVARVHPDTDVRVAPCGYPDAAPGDVLALDQ